MKNYYHLYIALMAGMAIGISTMLIDNHYNEQNHTQEPHKCKCITMKEILFHLEKREMFVDKLQSASRKNRSAIIDSINFHNAILDSTGNVIEY